MRAVWRMVMLGQEGSRFWLHYDNTVLASWQAIVKGRKRFFVCPPSESEHLAELVLPKRSTGKMSRTGNSRINPVWWAGQRHRDADPCQVGEQDGPHRAELTRALGGAGEGCML